MGVGGMDVTAAILKKGQTKKKKRYLLFLYNKRSDEINVKTVERVIQMGFKDHSIIRLEDPDEILRLILIKTIDLIIIDPEFIGDAAMTIEYAAEIKKRKKIPLLFLTDKEEMLLKYYRDQMTLYEESDDYCTMPLDFTDVSKRVGKVLQGNNRAAKRFQIANPVDIFRLDNGSVCKAILNDISLVGVGLITEDGDYRRGTQLQLRIPLKKFNFFHPQYGEFLKVAIKVQRLSIDAKNLGCSFEFLTTMQEESIQKILEYIARKKRIAQGAKKAPIPNHDIEHNINKALAAKQ